MERKEGGKAGGNDQSENYGKNSDISLVGRSFLELSAAVLPASISLADSMIQLIFHPKTPMTGGGERCYMGPSSLKGSLLQLCCLLGLQG